MFSYDRLGYGPLTKYWEPFTTKEGTTISGKEEGALYS
eukprot:SAG11_NODE_22774_length_400_cov_1.019934_1_plen_37_part_01